MTAVLLLLLAQSDTTFKARVRVEESRAGSDLVDHGSGTLVVRPGGVATLDGRRLPEGHPLTLWALEPREWSVRFEVFREAAPTERALPETVTDFKGGEVPLIRVSRARGSTAISEVEGPEEERYRLVPRAAGPGRVLIAWMRAGSLVRVEAEGTRRLVCRVEDLR